MSDAREPSTSAAGDDALRSLTGVLGMGAIVALFACAPMIPAVRRELHVSPEDVALSLGLFWLVATAGAVVFHTKGPQSRVYKLFDPIETAATQVCVLSLVFLSGRGDSFFWLPAIVHMMILGSYGRLVRFNYILLTSLPALLSAAFAIRGDIGSGAMCLVIGALGVFVYWFMLSISRKLAAAETALAETRVREERQRIARDIHDGIGADLAALDWRLRGLRAHQPAIAAEIDELTSRLGNGSAELRTIVWALRTPSRSWADIVAYLRQRAIELCGHGIRLDVVDEGDGGVTDRAGEVALDYMRAVLEMVRNAVRHADAKQIRVTLRSGPTGLSATVEDNGRGLPSAALETSQGGLANLKHRVSRAGGTIEAIGPAKGGTQILVELPAA